MARTCSKRRPQGLLWRLAFFPRSGLRGLRSDERLDRTWGALRRQTAVNIREWAGRRKQKPVRRPELRSKRLRCLFGIEGRLERPCGLEGRYWPSLHGRPASLTPASLKQGAGLKKGVWIVYPFRSSYRGGSVPPSARIFMFSSALVNDASLRALSASRAASSASIELS